MKRQAGRKNLLTLIVPLTQPAGFPASLIIPAVIARQRLEFMPGPEPT